jgi:hypothetical protein
VGYLIKATLGLGLFLGAIVLFNVKLISLLETGTCASGNQPFVVANECPEGTGTDILLLTGSVFAGLIGAALFAFRGDPPWGRRRRSSSMFGFGALAWGLFFTATGATSLYAALTDESFGADAELGGIIVGAAFLVMGLPVLLFSLWSSIKDLGARGDERPAVASAAAGGLGGGGIMDRMRAGLDQAQSAQSVGSRMQWGSAAGRSSGGDTIGRIERLQRLRESGAINDQEFEREKAKILAEQ